MQSSYKISRKSLNHNYLNFVEIVNRMSILMIFRYNIYKNGKRNKMNTLPIFFLKSFFSVGLTISHLLYCSLSLLVWWAKYLFFMITMHSYFDLLLSPLYVVALPFRDFTWMISSSQCFTLQLSSFPYMIIAITHSPSTVLIKRLCFGNCIVLEWSGEGSPYVW